jgi:chitin synthase
MAAILDSGFDDAPPPLPPTLRTYSQAPSPLMRHQHEYAAATQYEQQHQQQQQQHARFADQDGHGNGGYVSIDHPKTPDMPTSGNSVSSSVESRPNGGGHAKKRSGGAGMDRYGPLGPLADDDTGWGANGTGMGNGHRFNGRKL